VGAETKADDQSSLFASCNCGFGCGDRFVSDANRLTHGINPASLYIMLLYILMLAVCYIAMNAGR
jgi:hypothetical protein